jgi:predicted metalloprotease with PDZ domain
MRLESILGLVVSWVMLAGVTAGAEEIPAPVDRPYIGIMDLEVDASDVRQKIFAVHERIPVRAGPLVLLYPEWRLGAHAPAGGAIAQLAGLILSAGQRRIEWQRDPVNVYAFHVTVPQGVRELTADFQFLSPVEGNQGAIIATPVMLAVHWQSLFLYPAGYYARDIQCRPSVKFPDGWQFAGALEGAAPGSSPAHFKVVNLDDLIDSPIYAGKYFKRVDLDPNAKVPVFLDMVADHPEDLNASEAQLQAHRALVQQAYRMFNSHHYDHYDFLMALSDEFSFSGIEHHQSGENGVRTTYFSDWDHQQQWRSNLVSHEYIHSWDGKFRRPADQLTANFNMPMRDSLLWVYEVGTSYFGHVLGARSGLVETSQMEEGLAASAAIYDHRIGRRWRSLEDTTNDPVMNNRRSLGWMSWQRAEDYYAEGELIWLDADTLIRELSGEKKSLDDFSRLFFGVDDGRHEPLTYTFDDVANALDRVQKYDWAAFLKARLDGHGPGAPLDGLKRAGWRLNYGDKPTQFFKDVEAYRKTSDFTYSIGLSVNEEGRISDVLWEGPAYKAGVSQGLHLLAVNGLAYKADVLKRAITEAAQSHAPIELLLKQADRYSTVRLAYYDGLKYPYLERIPDTRDRLADIFKPLP